MRLRTLIHFAYSVVVALILTLPVPVLAQDGLTPEQLRLLQQMTPGQRQAVVV